MQKPIIGLFLVSIGFSEAFQAFVSYDYVFLLLGIKRLRFSSQGQRMAFGLINDF